MPRFLLIIGLLAVAAVLVARWLFAVRLLTGRGLEVLKIPGKPPATAAELGRDFREMALKEWEKTDPKAARSRAAARRFGMAVPPLALLVAVFAMLVGKVPLLAVLLVFIWALVLSTAVGLLSLSKELTIVSRTIASGRGSGMTPEELRLVAECAQAHAFNHSIPPFLRNAVR